MMTMKHTPQVGTAIEQARPQSERYLTDTKYDWLRPLSRRRALIGLSAAIVAAHSVLLWIDGPRLATLTLLGTGWLCYWLLRVAVRGMADLPEELIDERMSAVRNRAYRVAYAALSTATLTVLVGMWISADAARIAWQPQTHHLEALFWGFLFASVCLPSMLVAWTEREV